MEIDKTPVMCDLEARFCQDGQTVYDLLKKEYCDEKNGAGVLGKRWGVDPQSVLRVVKKCGLPVHPSFTSPGFDKVEEFDKRRKDALKASWEDEDKKRERIEQIHNENWKKAVKGSWENLSPEERVLRISKQEDTKRRNYLEKVKSYLADLEQGLSAAEIAAKLKKPKRTVSFWLRKIGQVPQTTTLTSEDIQRGRSLLQKAKEAGLIGCLREKDLLVLNARYGEEQVMSLEDIGKQLLGGVTRERVRQREARAIKILEKKLS